MFHCLLYYFWDLEIFFVIWRFSSCLDFTGVYIIVYLLIGAGVDEEKVRSGTQVDEKDLLCILDSAFLRVVLVYIIFSGDLRKVDFI